MPPAAPPLLTARLAAVAERVPAGRPMADIGTDHGRLPAFLVLSGRVPRAIGVDDKEAPLAGARALGDTLGLGAALEYRRGSGCAGLAGVDTVTVCGMGGALVARIVAGARAAGASTLVLQPNEGEAELRAALGPLGWRIVTERVLTDRGRRFVVMSATYGSPEELDAVDLAYGSARAHVDPAALAARLAADDARLRALVARHGPNPALTIQVDIVAEARARLTRSAR